MTRVVLCFGDSNTHGSLPMPDLATSGRFDHAARWPSVMGAVLGAGWEVINEGHPGRTTVHDDPTEGEHRNGVRVLPALLESHKPLDLVIIKLGTNDLKGCFSVNAADIAFSLERLVRIIRNAGAGPDAAAPAILVVAPPPILEVGCLAEMFEGGAAKSQRLASVIEAMTRRAEVGFFDAGRVIEVSIVDGIHYEAGAQVALGQAMAAAVIAQFGE